MLRRFSTNFALFSMVLDGLSVILSLWLSSIIRPWLNQWSFIEPIAIPVIIPAAINIIFPIIWILIFSSLSIYDGKRYIRIVDEFAALSLAVLIASISTAGVLFFSFRQVSRALFLVFVLLAYTIS